MADRIAISYSKSIAQGFYRNCDTVLVKDSAKTFWDRLTGRMQEKWPGRYPPTRPVTTKAAGALIGKSQNSAWKWSQGKPPELKHVCELAEKLDVCVEWLLMGRGKKFPEQNEDVLVSTLTALALNMSEPERMELLRYAHHLSLGSDPNELQQNQGTVKGRVSEGQHDPNPARTKSRAG